MVTDHPTTGIQLHRLRHSSSASMALTDIDDPQLYRSAGRFFSGSDPGTGPSLDRNLPIIKVTTHENGYRVTSPGNAVVHCDTRTDALVVLEHALSDLLLQRCPDCAHIHASGAVIGERAVLALGGSGAGKTSLALAWTMLGYPSLGDDIVLLDDAGLAVPFDRYFKVEPALLRRLGVDPASTPFWDATTQEAWYTPQDAHGWADSAPVGLLVICRRSRGSLLSIEPASRVEGLNALIHSRMGTGLDADSSFPLLHRVVTDAKVVRVCFESGPEAAEVVATYLRD